MDEEASFPYGEAGLFAFVVAKVTACMVLIRPLIALRRKKISFLQPSAHMDSGATEAGKEP
jgi:hypothetical protein